MNEFDQDEFNRFTDSEEVVGIKEEELVLASGQRSHFYAQWRDPQKDMFALCYIAKQVVAFAHSLELDPDCFVGVPEGATKLGLFASYFNAVKSGFFGPLTHCAPMMRAQPKTKHGIVANPADTHYNGAPSGRVVVIEDVTTTGGSMIAKGIRPLQETEGVEVVGAISLTHRMELVPGERISVEDYVKRETGVDYYWMSEAPSLLPSAYERLKAKIGDRADEFARLVEQEFAERGTVEVKLL